MKLDELYVLFKHCGSFCLLPADRDDRSFGRDRDRNRDSERFETDWRARPATDNFDDYPPRRSEDSFGDSEFLHRCNFLRKSETNIVALSCWQIYY